jgi:hypothetical protein
VSRELCQRAGAKAYIAGSISSLGSEYVLGLTAMNCNSGDTLAQEQVTANGKEKVLNAVGDAAAKLRGRLGESLATVQKFDVPLPEATTASLEALKAYSLGEKLLVSLVLPTPSLSINAPSNSIRVFPQHTRRWAIATTVWRRKDARSSITLKPFSYEHTQASGRS